jgi:hypothetical protein
MTPAARAMLTKCASGTVAADDKDKRWPQITELQIGRFVRLEWNTDAKLRVGDLRVAKVVLTDKGRSELASVAAEAGAGP